MYKIRKTGHIELRKQTENGFHRSVIAPNQGIPQSYKAEIEADPDFAKYRTAENSTAYEAQIESSKPDPPTKAQLKAEMKAEARRIAHERVLDAEIKKDPYLSAMAGVESKIDSGKINENARKAIRDEMKIKRKAK